MPTLRELICNFLCPKPKPTKPETLLTYRTVVNMLETYDEERLDSVGRSKFISRGLKFEDTRINTFDFDQLQNYMLYCQKLAKEKDIKLKGISFVKSVYSKENTRKEDFIGYESLIYIPTAIVNGQETHVDLIHSTRDQIVTFKEMLEKYGYEWRYDNKENFVLITTKLKDIKQEKLQEVKAMMRSGDELSIAGNKSNLAPPHDK
ncbi:hypothetical protein [Tenacibaculum sp. M341]|uniref:hypothetical protein n=1 Tax=Tenacibaculum sp. M341 TaxID=2530339 RepID=UPI001042F653|nr:hypothetical protein [Tenacibaculum sp. M341]TCI93517.1 hypothetical protein EYW44_03675 [Tenacibaculum sp. M341]